ncbi:ATP-binding protein [Geobacter sp. SVR]|uniref:PAS domain-containing sensor histidine kinase n=1 Tax=Geobacter sp. SVR TaxID=2495594 RepID=UPI00143EFE90|nr:ATP-binding protein [Geobacter sp. SVR]BCS53692.1 hypothetical protein GSVR_20000 [Geobacter sp. SVR]GCF85800.1 hypothetical protein GSbR_24000 [Geobacter sp. SVR]
MRSGNQTDSAVIEQMQQTMDDEKAFFSSLIQNAAIPMFVIDHTHTIIFWNNALARLTGRSSQQMVGTRRQWEPFYPSERPVLADLILDRKLQSISGLYPYSRSSNLLDDAYRAEGWFDNLGGERRYIYFEAAPITDARKEIVAAVEIIQDITHRKLAQEELDRAKREWEETLDSLNDFVILTDPHHRVRRCNRLLCDITGRQFDQLVGHDWRELLTGSGFAFINFDGSRGELLHNGSHRMYDLNIYTVNSPGNREVSGLVISINDTTEIRAITEKLQQTSDELSTAQRAIYQQEKMASIGQLAAGVAHEINNPIGFISSNLSTLKKYLSRFKEFIALQDQIIDAAGDDGGNMERIRQLRQKLKVDPILDDIDQLIVESLDGATRVNRIVQDLKNFSRVDQAECSSVNINDCLDATINIAWNEIKYLAVLNREYGELPRLKCFPQQLNQVFLNLLVNAAQALETQGEITVRTWADGGNIFVSIRDTGVGIPPEIADRIFEPFFTTKEVGQGVGLGLATSYEIVRKHRGDLSVESGPGIGATFTVRLPLDGISCQPGHVPGK